MIKTELTLIELVKPKLRKIFPSFEIFEEVGCLGGCIDMVLLKNEYLVVIEFKLKNWRKVVHQTYNRATYATECYCCLPDKNYSIHFYNEAIRRKIGILLYNEVNNELIVLAKPKKEYLLWKNYKTNMINRLKSRN